MTTFSSEVLMALLVAVTKYDKEELRKGWAVRILRDSHLKAEKKNRTTECTYVFWTKLQEDSSGNSWRVRNYSRMSYLECESTSYNTKESCLLEVSSH
jgi:hypothetical protein